MCRHMRILLSYVRGLFKGKVCGICDLFRYDSNRGLYRNEGWETL